MKKVFTGILLLFMGTMFAYNVGDVVGDLNWTDSNGENQSVHQLVESGKVVLFFWGENW